MQSVCSWQNGVLSRIRLTVGLPSEELWETGGKKKEEGEEEEGQGKKVGGGRRSAAHQLAGDSGLQGRDKAILAQSNHASITMLIGHPGKVPIINRRVRRQ